MGWSAAEKAALANLQLLAEYCMDVIARVGPDMRFSYVSPSAERLFRRPNDQAIGRNVAEFVLPEDLPIIAEATRRVLASGEGDMTVTVRVIRGDGTLVWTEINSRLIGDNALGAPGDRAVIMRDVSERKALEDELRAMAMKDGLTGLANRRAFDEAILKDWKRTLREQSHMSLLLIDIDHFKRFNDAHGHQVGDDCLRSVGAAIQAAVLRPGDLVARYGGDELAVVLPNSDTSAAAHVAQRVCAAVRALTIPHGSNAGGYVTVSVGVTTSLARDGGSAKMPEALLTSADAALYAAKAAGRNCWRSALLLASIA